MPQADAGIRDWVGCASSEVLDTWQKSEGQLTDRLCPSHSLQEFTEPVNIGNPHAGKRSLMADNAGTGTLETHLQRTLPVGTLE